MSSGALNKVGSSSTRLMELSPFFAESTIFAAALSGQSDWNNGIHGTGVLLWPMTEPVTRNNTCVIIVSGIVVGLGKRLTNKI